MKRNITIIFTLIALVVIAISGWRETLVSADTSFDNPKSNSIALNTQAGANVPRAGRLANACIRVAGEDGQPSCEQIVYSVARPNNVNNDLVLVNADGSDPVGLLPPEIDGKYPRISPNGRQIAFSSKIDQQLTRYNLYVMKSDGTGRLLLAAEIPLPGSGFSPDGTKIVFTRTNSYGQRADTFQP